MGTLKHNREYARIEQGGKCFYCACMMTDADSELETAVTADHKVPVAFGGPNHRSNIVAACYRCNHAKADNIFAEKRPGKHRRNRRADPIGQAQQERKKTERLQMWRVTHG